MSSAAPASEPRRLETLATLVRGDPARARAAAAFAARFLVTAVIAVVPAVALVGTAAVTPAAMAAIFLQLGRPLPVAWGNRIVTGIVLAVLLGGAASLGILLNGPVAAIVAIAVAFVVALAARASVLMAIARDPLLITFIFMGGLPATAGEALPAGIGGALATLVVVVVTGLFERQPRNDAAAAVAAALDGIADALDRRGGPAPAVEGLRIEVGAMATPIGSGRSGQALAGLMACVERQQSLLDQIEGEWSGEPPDLSALAEQNRACARALLGKAPPPREDESIERVRQHLLSAPDEVLQLVCRAGEDDPLARIDARFLLLDLELTLANAIELTRQAGGHSTPVRDRLVRDAPAPAVSRSRARVGANRVFALVSLHSAAMRDAVRLAAATGLAVAAIELLPIERGYWVLMAAVVALRASSHTTVQLGRYQLIGTVAGFLVALIPLALGAGAVIQIAIAAVALFLFAFSMQAGATLLGPASLTLVFVMALGQLAGSGFVIGTERVIDVGAGIVVAVLVAVVIWPGGRERLTARSLAESFGTAGELVRVTGAWLVHRTSNAETAAAWQGALASGARAEEALTALQAAPVDAKADYATAIRLHGVATRVRFHCGAALRNTDRVAPGETGMADLLDAEVDRTTGRFLGVASALEANEPERVGAVAPEHDPGELREALVRRAGALRNEPTDDQLAQFVYAALVWHWLREVALEAGAAEMLVPTLSPAGRA